MKAKGIVIGGLYEARVNSKTVLVRVETIRGRSGISGNQTHYGVVNTETGRRTWFRSAQKFRSTDSLPCPRCGKITAVHDDGKLFCHYAGEAHQTETEFCPGNERTYEEASRK